MSDFHGASLHSGESDSDREFYGSTDRQAGNVTGHELQEQKEAKGKYNNLQARFTEISEDLDYTGMLFSEHRDYEEIKLRNKKLENDLIHSGEKHLNELSRVRENFENQIKFRTSELQNEINELRQTKEQIDLKHNKHIGELHEVIESERNAQKDRFMEIIAHFQHILDRTSEFSAQLQGDFDSIAKQTTSLKNQTHELEFDLKKDFSDNLDVLKNALPFVTEYNKRETESFLERKERTVDDYGPLKSILKSSNKICSKFKNI